MHSGPIRRGRPCQARIARATIAALCVVSLSLAVLVAPSTGLAQSPGYEGPAMSQAAGAPFLTYARAR